MDEDSCAQRCALTALDDDGRVAAGDGIGVVIRAYDGRCELGAIDVRRLGLGARLLRGLRALGICWLIAIGALMVPVLHWVLVPAIALLGPIVGGLAARNDRVVSGGSGRCPVCANELHWRRAGRPEGFGQHCRGCRSTLQVAPRTSA